jgi:hypothetical protein
VLCFHTEEIHGGEVIDLPDTRNPTRLYPAEPCYIYNNMINAILKGAVSPVRSGLKVVWFNRTESTEELPVISNVIQSFANL